MRYIPLAIVMALTGLAITTPQNAKADVYVYKYYDYDYAYVKLNYSTWTTYDMFVDRWGDSGLRSEYFYDGGGRRWTLLDTTFSITPGYTYTGYSTVSRQYYRLCGTTYYSSATGCYYYRCKCGRTFYWVP